MAEAGISSERISVDDRLMVMLFLAGLAHLILILGITFAPPPPAGSGDVPTLEVMLVSDAVPESARNDEARYLSQRTQQGAGNTTDTARSEMPTASDSPFDQAGEPDARAPGEAGSTAAGAEEQALATEGMARRLRHSADAERPTADQAAAPVAMLAGTPTPLPSSEDDSRMRLKGAVRRELLVTPSTRQSDVAVYLDAWRRRVERVGTLNFPNQARREGMTGNPVVEVVLAADGSLAEASVRRSSGHPELDQAAIDILRLATPFEPFSRELAERHDALRFAYEWQFVQGQLTGSAVNVPAPSR